MPRLETINASDNAAVGEISTQISALKADVAGLTAALGQYVKAQKNNLGNAASDGMHAIHDHAVDQMNAARHMGEKSYANAESLVRNHPAGSIAVAAGVGFLVGLVTTRR